jgi:hypothetical protein
VAVRRAGSLKRIWSRATGAARDRPPGERQQHAREWRSRVGQEGDGRGCRVARKNTRPPAPIDRRARATGRVESGQGRGTRVSMATSKRGRSTVARGSAGARLLRFASVEVSEGSLTSTHRTRVADKQDRREPREQGLANDVARLWQHRLGRRDVTTGLRSAHSGTPFSRYCSPTHPCLRKRLALSERVRPATDLETEELLAGQIGRQVLGLDVAPPAAVAAGGGSGHGGHGDGGWGRAPRLRGQVG